MSNIKINKLKAGNKILLETKECVFDIEILDPENGRVIIIGGKRFIKPTEVNFVGVYGRLKVEDEDKLISENEIAKNLGLEIRYLDKDNIKCDFVTSPIISAKIYSEDWSFEMWEDQDAKDKLKSSLEEAKSRLRINTKAVEDEENED